MTAGHRSPTGRGVAWWAGAASRANVSDNDLAVMYHLLTTLAHTPRPEWIDWAACRGLPVELFFPSRGEPVAGALAVCSGCPVRLQCLDYALTLTDLGTDVARMGIWGATTEADRRVLRRARRKAS